MKSFSFRVALFWKKTEENWLVSQHSGECWFGCVSIYLLFYTYILYKYALVLWCVLCTNVSPYFLCSTDVNAGNTMRGSDMRVRVSVFVYVRSVKIRHSCNFPVVSWAINQADAWLRQEDGFCVVFILFCLSCRSLASPHLTHSLTQPLSGFSFFASLAITSSISKFIECKMLKTQCNIKSETKLRNEKDFPSILLLWHRGSFQLELSLGTALSPVLTAAAAAQQSKMGKTR